MELGTRERAALVLLAGVGILLPVFGWLVGVVLLWSSRLWTSGEKLVATVLTPGMLLIPVVAVLSSSADVCKRHGGVLRCGGGSGAISAGAVVVIYALLVLVPIATAVVLYRRGASRAQPNVKS